MELHFLHEDKQTDWELEAAILGVADLSELAWHW